MASGDDDGLLLLWDLSGRRAELRRTLHFPQGIVWKVRFSADGATLAVMDSNGSLFLLDVARDRVRPP